MGEFERWYKSVESDIKISAIMADDMLKSMFYDCWKEAKKLTWYDASLAPEKTVLLTDDYRIVEKRNGEWEDNHGYWVEEPEMFAYLPE